MLLLPLLLGCAPHVGVPPVVVDLARPAALSTETAPVPSPRELPCARAASVALERAGVPVVWDPRIAAAADWDLAEEAAGRSPTLAGEQRAAGAAGSPAILVRRLRGTGTDCTAYPWEALIPPPGTPGPARLGLAVRGDAGELRLTALVGAAGVHAGPGDVLYADEPGAALTLLVARGATVETRPVVETDDGALSLPHGPGDGWSELVRADGDTAHSLALLPPVDGAVEAPVGPPGTLSEAIRAVAPTVATVSNTPVGPCVTLPDTLDGVPLTREQRCAAAAVPEDASVAEGVEMVALRPLLGLGLGGPARPFVQAELADGEVRVRTIRPFGPATEAAAEAELRSVIAARWPGIQLRPAPPGVLRALVEANAADQAAAQAARSEELGGIARAWTPDAQFRWVVAWVQDLARAVEELPPLEQGVAYDFALVRGEGPGGIPAWHVALMVAGH
jgi:hypothetical protein